jgi:apyrase
MPLPRAQSYPQTQEYARARTFRQLALVVAFTVLVVALVALSALADVTGFESTRAAKTRYAVVIDAGSTGTRVHVFTFSRSAFASGGEALRDETFRSIEPGLKSYGGDAEAAATSIEALIDVAKGVVPESARRETPFSVRATAGLRLMPEGREAADAIVEAVRRKIANAGFHPSSASFVSIMDGEDEGAHAWVSVNYLLGNLGGAPEKTVTVVDLGGGSTQIAYAVGGGAAKDAPKGYVRDIEAASTTYRTYVHSFKGYGIVAVRPKIFSVGKNKDGSHPCLPNAFADSCEKDCYGLEPGETYAAIGSSDGSDFTRCLLATTQALEGNCAKAPCSFAGAWTTPRKTPLFVMSFIVERAIQGGAVPPPRRPTDIATMTPRDVKRAALRACSTPAAELEARFPVAARDAVDVNYLCLDLVYVYALLTVGHGAADDETIRALDKIRYRRRDVEASWALGDGIAAAAAAARA